MAKEWIELNETGQLYLEKILVTFDIPILFVCSDYENMKYLCLNIDSESGKTVIAPTDNDHLLSMLKNEISMENVFRNTINDTVIIAEYDSDVGKIISFTKDARTIPEDMLPQKGAYLELTNKSIEEYIEYLTKQKINYELKSTYNKKIFYKQMKPVCTNSNFENIDSIEINRILVTDTQNICSYSIATGNKMIA